MKKETEAEIEVGRVSATKQDSLIHLNQSLTKAALSLSLSLSLHPPPLQFVRVFGNDCKLH